MIEAYRQYKSVGISCLPTKKDKSPAVPEGWKNGFDESYFNDATGIGLICGAISGGLECIDFDNHFGDAKEVLTKFISTPEVAEIYNKHSLPIEKTMNGGFHLLFRCSYNEGNLKLAMRWNDSLQPPKPEAIIETRGEGGYFVASPTVGYNVVRNSILDIRELTKDERQTLIDVARSFNEFERVSRTEYEKDEKPGNIYNNDPSSIGETKQLLLNNGWAELGSNLWRRPDKRDGVSASYGKVAPNVFYNFSSSAYPFEANRAYLPFQILALLSFNGDFNAAATHLVRQGEKYAPNSKPRRQYQQVPESEEKDYSAMLQMAAIRTDMIVERPPVILTAIDVSGTQTIYKRIFTLGNFSCILGKAKSKKTFFITLITSVLLRNGDEMYHLKGSMLPNKEDILYFDTEQGQFDSYNCIRRIETMAGNSSKLKAFNLRPYSPIERCELIEYALKKYGKETGFCVIDGIADLAKAINDEEEATRVSTLLLRWTKEYNIHISTIIHQNKNDNFATGHLGSSIMKKAEILISVTKDSSDKYTSIVSCDMSRAMDFDEFSFTINSDGIPEIVSSRKQKAVQYVDYNDRDDRVPF